MTDKKEISRRKMLSRLGLAAGAVYLAPSLTTLSKARASSGSSGGSGGGSGGSSGGNSGASAGSAASAGSTSSPASFASAPSFASGPSFAGFGSSSPSNVGGVIGLIQERMKRL